MAFTVAAGGEVDAEGVYVFCDFGPVPTTNTVAVLKRLLELNLYLSLPFAPRLALNSETGHVLLIHREVQGQIEAPRLAAALDGMVKQAHAWRETRFLEPQPTGPARPPAPTQPATRPTPSRTSPVRAGGR